MCHHKNAKAEPKKHCSSKKRVLKEETFAIREFLPKSRNLILANFEILEVDHSRKRPFAKVNSCQKKLTFSRKVIFFYINL